MSIAVDSNAYIDDGLINEDDSCDLQVKYGENGQLYLQQGQFLVPTDGQVVMLQNEAGDFRQYVISNNDADIEEEYYVDQAHEPLICIATGEGGENIFQMDDVQESFNEGEDTSMIDFNSSSQGEESLDIEFQEDESQDIELQQEDQDLENINFVIPADIDDTNSFQYQFAILKDGKLQLQTINISPDDPNATEYTQPDGNNRNALEEQLAIFQESINLGKEFPVTTYKDTIDFDKIKGKNLITGQTVTLEKFFNKIQQRMTNINFMHPKKSSNSFVHKINHKKDLNVMLNKKVIVGTNKKGKKIFGKIIQIQKNEKEKQQTQCDMKKLSVTKENFKAVGNTLCGLMDMDSIQKKLINTNLEVKVVDKIFDPKINSFQKHISYIYGYMELSAVEAGNVNWKFIIPQDSKLGESNEDSEHKTTNCPCYQKIASLTLQRITDKYGGTITKVNLNNTKIFTHCILCKGDVTMKWGVSETRKQLQCRKVFSEQKCFKCQKTFSTASSLKRHVTIHDPSLRPLECQTCLQRFTDESSLKKHLVIHTGIRAYQCDVCCRTFVNQGDLNFHKRTHNPIKQFHCSVCGQEFSRFSNLTRHSEIHKGNNGIHQCHICGCSYSFVSTLTRHMVQKHLGEQIKH